MRALAVAAILCAAAARAGPEAVLAPSDAWVTLSTGELRAGYDRLWALSDVHGRLNELEQLLLASRLAVNEGGRIAWNPGARRELLVIDGDLLDGGKESVGVALLVEDLQAEAASAGSRIVVLLGNHEAAFLADPDRASRSLLRSARRAGLGPKGGLTGSELAQTRFGKFLRRLPVAAFVGTWLFAHAGYIDAGEGALDVRAYFARVASELEKGDYGALLDRKSIVASHDWWSSRRKRERVHQSVQALGMNGLVIGHDPDALGVHGWIGIDREGWLIKLDTGMKSGRSRGLLLRCEVRAIVREDALRMVDQGSPACGVVAPDGSTRKLAQE